MTNSSLLRASLCTLLTAACAGLFAACGSAPVDDAAPPADDAAVDAAPDAATPATPDPAPAAAPSPRPAAAPAGPASSPAPRAQAAAPVSPESPAPASRAAAPEPPPPVYRDVSAPAGTALSLQLVSAISTASALVETPVTARLREDLVVDGITLIPAGSTFYGNVTAVERPGRVRGRAQLVFRFTEAGIDGVREPVRTESLAFEGEATAGEDATKVGAGAGIGAVVGGLLGGGSGAAKGAAIGGAAGAGTVLATRGRDVELEAGTVLDTSLASPYEIRVEVR